MPEPRIVQRDGYTIELEREVDGSWIADIPAMPGVMLYGDTEEEAIENVLKLAREVEAE